MLHHDRREELAANAGFGALKELSSDLIVITAIIEPAVAPRKALKYGFIAERCVAQMRGGVDCGSSR